MIIMQNSAVGTNNVSGCEGETLFLFVSYTFLVVPNTKTGSLQLALFYTTLSLIASQKPLGTILISLECASFQQCTGTSSVCICCMVFEIQLFLIQNVVAPCDVAWVLTYAYVIECLSERLIVAWDIY